MDIADDPELLRASTPADEPLVLTALEAATRHVTGQAAFQITQAACHRYAPAGFLHGTFLALDRMATFFWFESERQGVLSLIGRDLRSMDSVHIGAAPTPPGSNVVPGTGTPQSRRRRRACAQRPSGARETPMNAIRARRAVCPC
jgi:hypothetical protein